MTPNDLQRTTAPTSKVPGFTLIELLVVITVIAILAGLILQGAGYAQRKGATSRAEAEVAALSAALESYKADMGDYPAGNFGNPTTTAAVTADNSALRTNLQPPTGKVYFEFPKSMGTNLATGPVTDPFGERYGYVYPNTYTNLGPSNFFVLWSRSGTTNSNQWIKTW